jgi:hypothetical protein
VAMGPMPPIDMAAFMQALQNNPDFLKTILDAANNAKRSTESMSGNFAGCVNGFTQGFSDLGLGFSRLASSSSTNFQGLCASAANHYWLLGATVVGAAYFYWYILPKMRIRVEYNSDARDPITHTHRVF